MSPLTAARIQMELSLGFHMIFAAIGVAMPLLMLIAEWRWIRRQDADARRLAHMWAKLTAVTFAIGAVSGTALSFELGLLWPRFMAFAGPLIGPAFALEGYAFFIEAIFLGLYLYGWERLPPRQHWWCGVAVAVSGAVSAVMVLAVNAWMQHPVGFTLSPTGAAVDVDAWAVFANPAWGPMALHSTLSCYQAVGFAAAANYAWTLWRQPAAARYARLGLTISMAVGTIAAIAQPLTGDLLAKRAHHHQPAKLAAMEALFETQRRAPLTHRRLAGCRTPRDALRDRDPRRAQLPRRQRHRDGGHRAGPVPARPVAERRRRCTSPSRSWSVRERPCPAPRSGTGWCGGAPVAARRRSRDGCSSRSSCAARSASSRSKPAGSSPKSAASRG